MEPILPGDEQCLKNIIDNYENDSDRTIFCLVADTLHSCFHPIEIVRQKLKCIWEDKTHNCKEKCITIDK